MTTILHDSDCAQHNEPAMPKGPCDCGAANLHTNEELCEALAEQRRRLCCDHDKTIAELARVRQVAADEIKKLRSALSVASDYLQHSLGVGSDYKGPNPYPIIDAALKS